MNSYDPPLDSPDPGSQPRLPDIRVVTPDSVHDLRGRTIEELRYPARSALLVAGIPGAGKSTALRLFFGAQADAEEPPRGPGGTVVLDSHHSRNRWRHKLGRLPYPLWRPVVHVAHYAGIRAALRDGAGPVVIHDCATFGWARRMIGRWATRYGRELHVILLDVPAGVARAGQLARGRRINPIFFTLHCRRWDRLIRAVDSGRPPRPEPVSTVVLDRTAIDRMSRVSFAA
ncbi:AAA family ATPase [Nocardia sp. CA-120079]|uniref:AAA family ATPase n=1 Tax=Nocardia sp. CA-120079 TaxID=3239974 RepID=UPI003D98AF0F